jgi:hypothetical protein
MEDFAQLAYEACQKYLMENAPDEADRYGFEGGMPWHELPPVYRAAWDAAAQAVLNTWDPVTEMRA